MKKVVIVLDFDQTITDWNNTLTKSRADMLAKVLLHLIKKYKVKIYILTLANKAHVYGTVFFSKSELLSKLIVTIPIISIEKRKYIYMIDKSLLESTKEKNKMIYEITSSQQYKNLPEYIGAYKKTNNLFNISKKEQVTPTNIFFLDDNVYNIQFAQYYNFRTYIINNHPIYKTKCLFHRLKLITNILNRWTKKNQ